MTRLRRLNPAGVKLFREFLKNIRQGEEFHESPAILHVDDYSTPVEQPITIENLPFANKLAAAEYLAAKLAPIHGAALTSDVGLWSWLALFYFDQLSPKDAEGKRRPRQDYHYIPATSGDRTADRHLLAAPYRLSVMHGPNARVLLHPQLHEHGQFLYDLGQRRDFISNRGLIEAVDLLYWDAKKSRPKRGATTPSRPGNLRRFISVLHQLEWNYDLYGMTAREILALLPPEFDAWKGQTFDSRSGGAGEVVSAAAAADRKSKG